MFTKGFDNILWDYINKLTCIRNSINEISLDQKISIYPNPDTNLITIKSEVQIKSILITNYLGQAYEVKLVNGKLDISKLQKCLYYLTVVSSTNKNLVKKIVIN